MGLSRILSYERAHIFECLESNSISSLPYHRAEYHEGDYRRGGRLGRPPSRSRPRCLRSQNAGRMRRGLVDITTAHTQARIARIYTYLRPARILAGTARQRASTIFGPEENKFALGPMHFVYRGRAASSVPEVACFIPSDTAGDYFDFDRMYVPSMHGKYLYVCII